MSPMNGEFEIDQIIKDELFSQKNNGIMFEIGAAKPDYLSIGYIFRKAGWRVISVEPNPIFAKMHREVGNEIYEYACSNVDKNDVDFTVVLFDGIEYEGGDITMESFSSLGIRNAYEEMLNKMENYISSDLLFADIKKSNIKVRVRTAETILEEASGINNVDLVTIDTEGWELECLQGYPFDRWPPSVLVIENISTENSDVETYLRDRGYSLWKKCPPNDIYISITTKPS